MKSKFVLLFVIVLAACLTQFASDIYAPSLVSISHALDAPIEYVQWSMAIYMLGVALSQLIYGPVSEGIGRRNPLIIGLLIMLAGSILCWVAPGIEILIMGRFIQGCGAGAAASLWRSVFRDVFKGEELAKFGSYMVILVMFIVPAAPALGGILEASIGWRANFVFMSCYTLIAVAAVILFLRETNLYLHRDRLQLSYIGQTYLSLIKSPIFMGITVCTFLCYGAFFSWMVAGPVILIERLNMTPLEFGWITFFGGGTAYVVAGILNGRVVERFGMAAMMRFGWSVMLISGICLLVGHYFFSELSVEFVVASMILFYFGSTLIWPNAFAIAFTPYGKIAGYAGALYGFMQIGGAACIGGVISLLPEGDVISLSVVIIACTLFSWVIFERIHKRNQV